MIPNILSIAGSDPSSGAGIQADIKAISANRAYAIAAVTAFTAQNTQGISGIHLVPPDFVQSQIEAVFADIRVDAVKIGMIANAQIANAVADVLKQHTGIPIVLDPVMIAKGGAALLQPDVVITLRNALLPLATILIPKLPEEAHLPGTQTATSREEMAELGRALCALGAQAVLMKGGHLDGEGSPDCLVSKHDVTWFEAVRIATRNTHGTGCTLSSALAAQLSKGLTLIQATAAAKSYVVQAIAQAGDLSVGAGHGPTHHFATLYSK